jgi:hypothetical protein
VLDHVAYLRLLALRAEGVEIHGRISGDSMWPLLRQGDVVHVLRLGSKSAQRGDIVVADMGGWLIAHRVATEGDPLRLQGDASLAHEIVRASSLLGIVRSVERSGKEWNLKGPAGRIIANLVPWIRPSLVACRLARHGARRFVRAIIQATPAKALYRSATSRAVVVSVAGPEGIEPWLKFVLSMGGSPNPADVVAVKARQARRQPALALASRGRRIVACGYRIRGYDAPVTVVSSQWSHAGLEERLVRALA